MIRLSFTLQTFQQLPMSEYKNGRRIMPPRRGKQRSGLTKAQNADNGDVKPPRPIANDTTGDTLASSEDLNHNTLDKHRLDLGHNIVKENTAQGNETTNEESHTSVSRISSEQETAETFFNTFDESGEKSVSKIINSHVNQRVYKLLKCVSESLSNLSQEQLLKYCGNQRVLENDMRNIVIQYNNQNNVSKSQTKKKELTDGERCQAVKRSRGQTRCSFRHVEGSQFCKKHEHLQGSN